MVKRSDSLDGIFGCLSDATRRDILLRLRTKPLTVTEVADEYSMSLAAVSKHLKILENAGMITRKQDGRRYLFTLSQQSLQSPQEFLDKVRSNRDHGKKASKGFFSLFTSTR